MYQMQSSLKYVSLLICFFLVSCAVFKGKNSTSTHVNGDKKVSAQDQQKPIRVTARSLYQQNQRLMRQNTALMKKIVKLEEQLVDDRVAYEKKLTRMDRTIALMEKHLTVMKKNQTGLQNSVTQKTPVANTNRPARVKKNLPVASTPKNTTMDPSVISTLASNIQPNEISTPGKSTAIEAFSLENNQPKPLKRKKTTVFQAVPVARKTANERKTSGWEDPDLNPPAAPLKLRVRAGAKRYYNAAFKQYAEKNYSVAINEFKNFLSKFPNDQDADNAQFWIGYANYHLENYRQAEFEFRKVLRNYYHRETKHGYKTPDTILMLGRIYIKKDKPIKARYYFKQLVDIFPDTRSAQKAKMEIEAMESF